MWSLFILPYLQIFTQVIVYQTRKLKMVITLLRLYIVCVCGFWQGCTHVCTLNFHVIFNDKRIYHPCTRIVYNVQNFCLEYRTWKTIHGTILHFYIKLIKSLTYRVFSRMRHITMIFICGLLAIWTLLFARHVCHCNNSV